MIIGGATGSGKSGLAMRIARAIPSEIVNADSRQVYRELVIGTSCPSESDRNEVPHHLFSFLPPGAEYSAAEFEKQAIPVLSHIRKRDRWAIVVGGTGFYIRALLRGVWTVPPKDPKLRERLLKIATQKGNSYFHRLLARVDPESATQIPRNDTYRMIRALEIYCLTGNRRSSFPHQQKQRFPALKFFIACDREQLEKRIRERMEDMFQRGWVEEVRQLLQKYPGFESFPASRALGYPEIVRHLKGEMDLQTCKQSVLQQTLRYAKRQATWFRNQDSFTSVSGESELHKIMNSVLQWKGPNESVKRL